MESSSDENIAASSTCSPNPAHLFCTSCLKQAQGFDEVRHLFLFHGVPLHRVAFQRHARTTTPQGTDPPSRSRENGRFAQAVPRPGMAVMELKGPVVLRHAEAQLKSSDFNRFCSSPSSSSCDFGSCSARTLRKLKDSAPEVVLGSLSLETDPVDLVARQLDGPFLLFFLIHALREYCTRLVHVSAAPRDSASDFKEVYGSCSATLVRSSQDCFKFLLAVADGSSSPLVKERSVPKPGPVSLSERFDLCRFDTDLQHWGFHNLGERFRAAEWKPVRTLLMGDLHQDVTKSGELVRRKVQDVQPKPAHTYHICQRGRSFAGSAH